LAKHPELKSTLLKEFWYAGDKIYEVYEIDRPPEVSQSVMSDVKFNDPTQRKQ